MEWSNASLGDGFCDQECMTPDCFYDSVPNSIAADQTPREYFEDHSDCWQDCHTDYWNSYFTDDSECDTWCDISVCGFDFGDCSYICNTGCFTNMLGNGSCDEACNTTTCNLDNGDCGFCSNEEGNTCDSDKIANDTCDEECNSFYCNFDSNSCGGEYCNSEQTCQTTMIDNNVWEEACQSESCNYDGQDCTAKMYVSGGSDTFTPRNGTIIDPHRSLTGAMASI